jgi:hypothetical protein
MLKVRFDIRRVKWEGEKKRKCHRQANKVYVKLAAEKDPKPWPPEKLHLDAIRALAKG